MKKNIKYEQFGRLFGREIHMIESSEVDPSYKSKEEAVSIKVPAVLHTIKSIRVNTLRQTMLQGGVEAVVINGGEKELCIGLNEEIVTSASKFTENREKKAFFGEYKVANDICNAGNRSEIARLQEIVSYCKAQIDTLNGVIDANERAVTAYSGE